jgi:hypothetical protein
MASINLEVEKARSDIDLFFALKQHKEDAGEEITESYKKKPQQ